MFLRRSIASMLGALMLLGGMALANETQAADEIAMGTLAPRQSLWGKVFSAWGKAVKKKTDGQLELKWYFNAAQGDEGAMIAKMRSGQLDGAAVTSVGLSKISRNFLALQMPGLCTNWGCLDKVRNAILPELQAQAKAKGFVLLGKGDVGIARTYSKGKAIRSPEDLKTMKVYQWVDDPIAPVTASVIGYTGAKTTVPGLLPMLSSGRINVATVPSLAASQLQWIPHFDHVTKQAAGVAIGGLIITKSKLDSLPGDAREVLQSTAKKAGKMLTSRIRKADQKSYRAAAKRMTVVDLSAAEQALWRAKFKQIRRRLGQGTFSASFVAKLEGLAGI